MATQFGTMKTFKRLKDLFLSDPPHVRLWWPRTWRLGSSGNRRPSALVPCSCASPCTVPLVMSPWLWRWDGSLTWRAAKGLPGFLAGQLSLLSILSPHMHRTAVGSWSSDRVLRQRLWAVVGYCHFRFGDSFWAELGHSFVPHFLLYLLLWSNNAQVSHPFLVGLSYNNQHFYSYSTLRLKNSFTFNSHNNRVSRNY